MKKHKNKYCKTCFEAGYNLGKEEVKACLEMLDLSDKHANKLIKRWNK